MGYVLIKESGHNSNLTLINQETHASIIIGKLTLGILEILKGEGYTFSSTKEDGKLRHIDKWELNISQEVGQILAKRALSITKPVRKQKEKINKNKNIDALDVLLGLANYN